MRDFAFAIPGDLAAPTGGYEYARRLITHLPEQGFRALPLMLAGSFPAPSRADLAATAAAFAQLPPGRPLLVDGLAYGALPPEVIAAAGDCPIVALVHHPLGLEAGLSPQRADELLASEKAALRLARRIIVTSPYTARLLVERFAIAPEGIDVARPGTEPASRVMPRRGGEVALLAIGAVTPRKGYDVLRRALTPLVDLPWRLTLAGALDRAPRHVADFVLEVARGDLRERIDLAGPVPEEALERLYRGADVMVSASLFEGYGMALADALARGLPVVMARGGAADETVPDDAALKVAPGNVEDLTVALRTIVTDAELRARLADQAWAAGRDLPRWPETAAAVAAALRVVP